MSLSPAPGAGPAGGRSPNLTLRPRSAPTGRAGNAASARCFSEPSLPRVRGAGAARGGRLRLASPRGGDRAEGNGAPVSETGIRGQAGHGGPRGRPGAWPAVGWARASGRGGTARAGRRTGKGSSPRGGSRGFRCPLAGAQALRAGPAQPACGPLRGRAPVSPLRGRPAAAGGEAAAGGQGGLGSEVPVSGTQSGRRDHLNARKRWGQRGVQAVCTLHPGPGPSVRPS